MMRALFLRLLFAFFVTPAVAGAAPITVVLEGTSFGGSMGGIVLSHPIFHITISSDTTGIESFDEGWSLQSAVASISIQGIGTADFTIPTHVFVNNVYKSVGFSMGMLSGSDLLDLVCNIDCSTWDLTTSFGPVYNASFVFLGMTSPGIDTTLGPLTLTPAFRDVTFEAFVTPEPATGLLLAAGLTALAVRRRSVKMRAAPVLPRGRNRGARAGGESSAWSAARPHAQPGPPGGGPARSRRLRLTSRAMKIAG